MISSVGVVSRYLLSVAMFSVGFVLSGCAVNVNKLPPEQNPSINRGDVKLPEGSIIAIQFPMMGSDEAKRQLVSTYACRFNDMIDYHQSSCGILMPSGTYSGEHAPQLFEISTYYAAELKKILSRYISEGQVRLEPYSIGYNNGHFFSRPVLPSRSPTPLVVDLYALPHGHVGVIGSGYEQKVNIRTAGIAAPNTCGNLLLADRHFLFDAEKSRECQQHDARNTPGFMPLQFFADRTPAQVDFPKRDKGGIGPDAVLTFKWLSAGYEDNYLRRSSQPGFNVNAGTIENQTSDWIARMALDALSKIDVQAAFDVSFISYVESYDPALAQRMKENRKNEGDERRLSIVRKLLDAENDWLSSQNSALTEGILNGDYGASFRQARLLMAEAFNRGRQLSWMQLGTTMAMGLNSGLLGGSATYNPEMMLNQTLMTEQTFGNARAQLEQALLKNIAPSVDMRTQVIQVSIEGMKTDIQGGDQSTIHAQLQSIYNKLTAK